jgi:serine O-acetyltransferase
MGQRVRREALAIEQNEPEMAALMRNTVLSPNVSTLEQAIALTVAQRFATDNMPITTLNAALNSALSDDGVTELGVSMAAAVRADLAAVLSRDPASKTALEVILFFKGFAALVAHRVAFRRWHRGGTCCSGKTMVVSSSSSASSSPPKQGGGVASGRFMALWLQARASTECGVDIHPGAQIGAGVMLDHGTGIVIGETAVVGDGCTLLHGVTLGGVGNTQEHDRHPKLGRNVLLGAGATVLGNIKIGNGAKIGAGSVVLRPIPHDATAVGVPAKVIGRATEASTGTTAAGEMDHALTFVKAGPRKANSERHLSSEKTDPQTLQAMLALQVPTPPPTPPQSPAAEGSKSPEAPPAFTLPDSATDDKFCVFRHWNPSLMPNGAVTYAILDSVLAPEGLAEDEIGEIFFELDDENQGFVSETAFKENFPVVAKKYSNGCGGVGCPKTRKLLDAVLARAATVMGMLTNNPKN